MAPSAPTVGQGGTTEPPAMSGVDSYRMRRTATLQGRPLLPLTALLPESRTLIRQSAEPPYGVPVGATNSDEEALIGGNAAASVVRIGDIVHKPWLQTTELTVAYMRALRDRGIDLPEPRGRDAQGRLVLEYVPGDLAISRGPLEASLLRRIGALKAS
jgi:hypothetical protein